MIGLVIQLLQVDEFYGKSKLIDIAKGKHKIPTSIKENKKQIKRAKAWQ